METKTKATPKLSRVPRGHWRNVIRFVPGRANWDRHTIVSAEHGDWLDEFHYLGARKWPCKDSAETAAQRGMAARGPRYRSRHVWLGAEFFPEA